jgi:hypothetical protein
VEPTPIIPDYAGANVRGIVPALLGPEAWATNLPPWMPAVLADARQIVLLVLDGLGWDQLMDHKALMPTLGALSGTSITTVAPTTTATALTSISTGLTPGEHGLIGYRIALHTEVLNLLRWTSGGGDRRHAHPPRDLQPFTPFLGRDVPVISQVELERTAFTEAHLRGSKPAGYRSPSAIAPEVAHQLLAGEDVVYAYYGGIDKTAHERGFGAYYDAELIFADHLVAAVLDVLPAGAALLVTADHGQVHVGENILYPSEDLLRSVALQSGEGRFRWLHAKPGAARELLHTATDEFGEVAWVVTREQTIDEGWFGPVVSPPVAARLGDVALVAHEQVSFWEGTDTGPFELVCRHGSLTAAEVLVPLLAFLSEP